MSLIGKNTKLNTNVYKEGKNNRWSEVQYEELKAGNYSTLAPSGKYKHAALAILKDEECVSLMEFDNYEDLANEMGLDLNKVPDLDAMKNGQKNEMMGTEYIKLW